MPCNGGARLAIAAERVGFCYGEQELPSFKGGARATGSKPLDVDGFHCFEGWVAIDGNLLGSELVIHVIMDAEQPLGKVLITIDGILNHVFRKAFATVFAGENIWKCFKEGAGRFVARCETYEMEESPS